MTANNTPPEKVDTLNPSRTEAGAVANVVRRLSKPQTMPVKAGAPDGSAMDLVLVPEGFNVMSVKKHLDEYLDAPRRREGTAELADLDSFTAHVNRFRDDGSVIFADRSNENAPTLTCVLDYHPIGAKSPPRNAKHRARYAFPLSDEWKEWKAKNKKSFAQVDFAQFIENRIADVAAPESAHAGALEFRDTLGCTFATSVKLLELSRGLEVRVESVAKEIRRLENGEGQVIYTETHKDASGQTLSIPSAFLIAIPVFRSGPRYQLPIRLRYRMNGPISWFYEIYRDDVVFDHAFAEACATANEVTTLPVLQGKPEAT